MKFVLKIKLTCKVDADDPEHSYLQRVQVDVHGSRDKRTDSGVDGLVHNSRDRRVADRIYLLGHLDIDLLTEAAVYSSLANVQVDTKNSLGTDEEVWTKKSGGIFHYIHGR